MQKLREELSGKLGEAFEALSLDKTFAVVNPSNRPDLCEFQCNGALAIAKKEKKKPMDIAEALAEKLRETGEDVFSRVEAAPPGFLNLKVKEEYLASRLSAMQKDERFGFEKAEKPKKIIVDYGGPNVAKPLHVGHLRAAIIGESIKRICRYAGHTVIGDVHLGDWGLQMGLIISELKARKPDLPYFDESFEGEYPKEAPFTISELEEIYPAASAKAKEDEAFHDEAMKATKELQQGRRGYKALFQHILDISVADLKENYRKLMVDFDLWMGESDVQDLIPPMVEKMKTEGFAYESEGAWVVDIAEEGDKKELPPCILLKSDGASLYTTTDLATLVWRQEHEKPDQVVYVVDKRQELHFTQVFRTAKKTGIVPQDTALDFIGFGTMNGKDGKPFKTREGGVMRLESLINEIREEMEKKLEGSDRIGTKEEASETAAVIALSAIKYGDLSNQASKDYVFDVERFTSSEGNTGPYILYTIARIKSILRKFEEAGGVLTEGEIHPAGGPSEKALALSLCGFQEVIEGAAEDLAPHRICAYIYELSDVFNHFYHETKILATEDEETKQGYLRLLNLTKNILLQCIDLLGFTAPEAM